METREKVDYKRIIISLLAAGGFLAAALVVPNAVQALKLLIPKAKRRREYYIKSKVGQLIERGLIEVKRAQGQSFLRLTVRGKSELLKYQSPERYPRREKKKWDRRWRIVIFDIHEYNRRTRDNLRRELVQFGFRRLQHSVWVTPVECEEFILLLKASLKLGKSVIYFETDKFAGEQMWREQFGLA